MIPGRENPAFSEYLYLKACALLLYHAHYENPKAVDYETRGGRISFAQRTHTRKFHKTRKVGET